MKLASPISLIAVTLLGMTSHASGAEPFFFIQMADPQFGFIDPADPTYAAEVERFEKAIAHANRLKPAFVVVSGDLVNTPGDAKQIAVYKRITAMLDKDIPLYSVAGNHDMGNMPTKKSRADYIETFGPDRYTFEHGPMKAIVFNTTIIKGPDHMADEIDRQFAWLQAELQKATDAGGQPILVFVHHPLFLKAADEPEEYFNIPPAVRSKYLALFARHNVRAVFAGHYHRNAHARDGALEMITNGPIGKELGKDPSGLRIVKVSDGQIEHEYYSLDDVPESVSAQ